MDWDKLRLFLAVAETGRLSLAAQRLFMSQSALSRQIAALEAELPAKLFHRHARGLLLTEQGNMLFEAAESMRKSLETASARIRDTKDIASGELRVTTTVGFGTLWLAPKLPRFFAAYPQLNLNLMLEERVLDLAMREADCAIRMQEPSQADLIRRMLMNTRLRLYASQAFLASSGEPRDLYDLKRVRLISQHFSALKSVAGALYLRELAMPDDQQHMIVNNYYGVLQGVRNSLGIGVMPDYISYHVSDLVQVLPEHASERIPIYFAYPVELRDSCKLQVFRDFVLTEARQFVRGQDGN